MLPVVPQCTHTHAHKKKHTHIHTVSNILLVLLSQYQHHNIIISALRHCYCYCYCSYCCFCCRQHTHAHNTHTAQTEHLTNSRIKLRSRFNDLCFILIYIFGAIKFLFDLVTRRDDCAIRPITLTLRMEMNSLSLCCSLVAHQQPPHCDISQHSLTRSLCVSLFT